MIPILNVSQEPELRISDEETTYKCFAQQKMYPNIMNHSAYQERPSTIEMIIQSGHRNLFVVNYNYRIDSQQQAQTYGENMKKISLCIEGDIIPGNLGI